MAERGERFTQELTVRYVAVLTVLGVLALISFLGLNRLSSGVEAVVAQADQVGRMRVLVERIAFSANRLAALPATERDAAATQLILTLDELDGLNHVLAPRNGAETDGTVRRLPPEAAPVVAALGTFVDLGRSVIVRADDLTGTDTGLAALSDAAAGPLLDQLDSLTRRVQRANVERMDEVLVLQGVTLLVALGVLLVSAVGVFHPMVDRLRADLAERARFARDLMESEARLRQILEESPMGVSVSRRADGQVVFANARFAEILRLRREEFIGSYARDHYVDETQRRTILAALRRVGQIDGAEVEFRRKDGTPFWALLTIRSTQFEGEPVNLAWIYDITERKAVDRQIRLAAKVLDTLREAVIITDAANEIVFVNPAFTEITEYERDEVIGGNPRLLASGRHDRAFYEAMWQRLLSTGAWSGEVWNRRKSGALFAEWLSIVAIQDPQGRTTNHVAVFSDITHRKEDEARIWRQANYDGLTGLPNRSLFLDRLAQAVQQGRRDGRHFAVMFLDLDGFKAVNDTLGHAAGDQLLQEAAKRLEQSVRASDTLARFGGDEFVVILPAIQGREDPARVAGKILEQLARPFDLEGRPAEVRGSVGIALFPGDAEDGAALLQCADQAMYEVKRQGKNGYRFADEGYVAEPA